MPTRFATSFASGNGDRWWCCCWSSWAPAARQPCSGGLGNFWPPALLVSAAAAVHLRMAQRRAPSRWPKEISAALTYTAGIWFAPLMLAPVIDRWAATAVAMHFLAALLNLLTFALFEKRSDILDGFSSIPGTWGDRATRVALIVTDRGGPAGRDVRTRVGSRTPRSGVHRPALARRAARSDDLLRDLVRPERAIQVLRRSGVLADGLSPLGTSSCLVMPRPGPPRASIS